MSETSIDRHVARAESALDRLDDEDDVEAAEAAALDPDEAAAMHVEDDDLVIDLDEGEEPLLHGDESLTDAVEVFIEAFNARDLDAVLEAVTDDVEAPGLGYDRDNLPEAIEELWERRPSSLLTRGRLEDRCVAVVWELGTGTQWWRIAVVHFDDVDDGRLGVVEFNDDPAALEEVETDVPDGDVDEGVRWEEWEDGAPPEG